jgi:hypothetical protein
MHRFVNTLTLLVLIDLWWRAASILKRLPQKIPIHFNIFGRPDNWGSRWMIFLLPIIASVIAVTFLLGIVRPGQVPTTSLTRPERLPVSCLMLVIALGFTFINRRIVDCALGVTDGLGKLFLPVFLAAVLGISGWLSIIGGRK